MQMGSTAVTSAVAHNRKKRSTFPLVGGALKCCSCNRWHNVPETVMHEVRCPSPSRETVWWMSCGGVVGPFLLSWTRCAGSEERWSQLHVRLVECVAHGLQVLRVCE